MGQMGDKHGNAARQPPGAGWGLAAALLTLAALVLRLRQFSLFDIGYSDELLQYLEQANRLVTGHGVMPWETRAGLRNGLIPQVLAPPVWLGHVLAPGTLLHVALARATFLAFTLLALPAAWRIGALHSRSAALVTLCAAALWWESVLFSQFILAESLGTALMLLGAAPLLDKQASRRSLVAGGFLVALAVLVRMQYAVFAGVLVLAALRLDRQRWFPVAFGGLIAALLGALSDLVMGMTPFGWVLVGLRMNVGEGIAARFGTSGPFAYLGMLDLHLWPIFIPVLVGALFSGPRHRPLLLAALANLLAHSLIGHKEYRFVWLTTLTLLLLAAVALVRLADRLARDRGHSRGTDLRGALGLCCVVALLSGVSSWMTGGSSAWRGGGAIPRLAEMATTDGAVCGVAVAYEFKSHVVPALLPRPVPLMLAPEGVLNGMRPLSPRLAAAANALVLNANTPVPSAYVRRTCLPLAGDSPCLYIRPGSCAPDAGDSYQQAIARHGL